MIRDSFYNEEIKGLLSGDSWLIQQENYRSEKNLVYETLFCLTNGYMGTRGAFEEGTVNSLPCTFVNGVFDKSETFMRELANLPNWLGMKLYVQKQLISIDECEILEFLRVLDMKRSLLIKKVKLRDKEGRETLVEGIRFVSRNNVHRSGIRLYFTPLNYSGIIELENSMDGSVINFADSPRFKVKHTEVMENSSLNGRGCYVEVRTRDNHLHVGMGSVIRVYAEKKESIVKAKQFNAFGEIAVEFNDFYANQGQTYVLEKFVSTYTERELPKEQLKGKIQQELVEFVQDTMNEEIRKHSEVYDDMWKVANIEIEGDFEVDRAVRFNIYHLMSTGSEHDEHVNVGAKLLHGEEYGGHAFWDTELFMLPFFNYVFPKTAKNLLSYRYHLLNPARENAKFNGFKGAKYPWESADTGVEECPDWTILPDGSCYRCYVAKYEHHVTSAVAFGIHNFYNITGDESFLLNVGAEMLLEIARFWNSRCEYNEKEDRYEITEVTGPDEWHEPVNNNCYTNYLAKWSINKGIEIHAYLKEKHPVVFEDLTSKLCLTSDEINEWYHTQSKIYLPRKENDKLLEQFEGYFSLKDVVIEEYDENDMPIKPKILQSVKRQDTQIIKQADIVMLTYLLGNEFDLETQKVNYDYYEKRTLHGSSLSPSIHAIMGLRVGDDSKAYRYLKRAAFIDLLDLQKNTREGFHAANAGGVWKTVVFGFAGIHLDDENTLCIRPKLPDNWSKLCFKLTVQGSHIKVSITNKNDVSFELVAGPPLSYKVNNEEKIMC